MTQGTERAPFHPTINRHSRLLASGSVPILERHKQDMVDRRIRHQQLLARAEAEHRLSETFRPVTNSYRHATNAFPTAHDPSPRGVGRVGSAGSVGRVGSAGSVGRVGSAGSVGRVGSVGCRAPAAAQSAPDVRRRVQDLWREHAGIGCGEMPYSGVLAALRELGLPASSPVAEKFILALGLNEEAGVRCVAYDRFSMVFTAVLREALLPAQKKENIDDAPLPTMRRRSASVAGDDKAGEASAVIEKHNFPENAKWEGNEDEKSPSPVAPRARVGRAKRPLLNVLRPSSCMEHQAHAPKARKKPPPYDPLSACTFAPAINKKYRRPSSAITQSERGASGKAMAPSKPQEERELEHCTFAPNTAQFHTQRDSLAWWKREPFDASSTSVLPTPSTEDLSPEVEKPTQTCGPMAGAPLAAGFDKTVRRMIEARRRSQPGFEESLRSSIACSNDGSGGTVTRPPLHTVVEPFTLRSEARMLRREQQRPLMYVDVDLPSGRTGRIGVHNGDQPEALAASFAQAYGLGDELRNRLEQMLREKLQERLQQDAPTLWL